MNFKISELKKVYQRNMLIGFGIAGGLHLVIIGVTAIIVAMNSTTAIKADPIVLGKLSDWLPPPTDEHRRNGFIERGAVHIDGGA